MLQNILGFFKPALSTEQFNERPFIRNSWNAASAIVCAAVMNYIHEQVGREHNTNTLVLTFMTGCMGGLVFSNYCYDQYDHIYKKMPLLTAFNGLVQQANEVANEVNELFLKRDEYTADLLDNINLNIKDVCDYSPDNLTVKERLVVQITALKNLIKQLEQDKEKNNLSEADPFWRDSQLEQFLGIMPSRQNTI